MSCSCVVHPPARRASSRLPHCVQSEVSEDRRPRMPRAVLTRLFPHLPSLARADGGRLALGYNAQCPTVAFPLCVQLERTAVVARRWH